MGVIREAISSCIYNVVPYQAKKKSTRPAVDAYNIIQPPEDYSFCRIEKILDAKNEEPRKPISPRGKVKQQPADGSKSGSKGLKLNNNSITNIECLPEFAKIKFSVWEDIAWVDLSQNELTKLGPELSEFVSLQILYLHGNQINDITQIDQLTPLRCLRKLTLHGNPIEQTKGYRFIVLSKLPHLQSLDFSCVTKADRNTRDFGMKMNAWGTKKKKKITEEED